MSNEVSQIRAHRQSGSNSLRKDEDRRGDYQRDYGRLIHSPSFRRLQGKSQIFGAGSGDYYRTRLTHSLEVAQIARVVANRLRTDCNDSPGLTIDPEVVECACLAHDIGHPPFGHKGEEVLNDILSGYGGFEGNAQNFRILMSLDERKDNGFGLDLTDAVLLAVNKYPNEFIQGYAKGVYKKEWEYISSIREKWRIPIGKATLEAQLMDLCDDIAYSTHDVEDGIRAGKIRIDGLSKDDEIEQISTLIVSGIVKDKPLLWDQFKCEEEIKGEVKLILKWVFEKWQEAVSDCGGSRSIALRELKSALVNEFANSVGVIPDGQWSRVTLLNRKSSSTSEDHALLRKVMVLKQLSWITVVSDFRVQRLQIRSKTVLQGIWDVFDSQVDKKEGVWNILPRDWKRREDKFESIHRLIGDYIAGMTDAYAEKVYAEFFGGKSGSIYERD